MTRFMEEVAKTRLRVGTNSIKFMAERATTGCTEEDTPTPSTVKRETTRSMEGIMPMFYGAELAMTG